MTVLIATVGYRNYMVCVTEVVQECEWHWSILMWHHRVSHFSHTTLYDFPPDTQSDSGHGLLTTPTINPYQLRVQQT